MTFQYSRWEGEEQGHPGLNNPAQIQPQNFHQYLPFFILIYKGKEEIFKHLERIPLFHFIFWRLWWEWEIVIILTIISHNQSVSQDSDQSVIQVRAKWDWREKPKLSTGTFCSW